MSDDQERLVAEVDPGLKGMARADPRTIKEVVESALQREFSTAETAAVERRIEEKQQRIQTLEREINERKRELAQEEDELERLKSRLETFNDRREEVLEQARETLKDTPKEPDNPAVERWAEELNMTPTELLEEL